MRGSVGTILVTLTSLVTRAEFISSESIRTEDLIIYGHQETSKDSGKYNPWRSQTSSLDETEYDRLQRQQADLCRQGEIGATGQLQEICSKWRFKYIDEQRASGFEVKIVEDSFDRRLANVIYTTIATKAYVPDFIKVTAEDPDEMERNFRSLEGPLVDGERCAWQLKQMVAQLDELEARLEIKRQNASFRLGLDERHIRLALAMDSHGRYEAGLLSGKFLSMGAYKECQSSLLLLPTHKSDELDQEGEELVKTRFCWALMDLSKHRSASLKARQTDSFEASQHLLHLGVCLPRSCHTRRFLKPQAGRITNVNEVTLSSHQQEKNRELVQRLIDSQFKLPSSLYIDESLPLHSVYCLADEQSAYKVPFSGQLALAFLCTWFLLAVYATYYQEVRRKRDASNRKKNDNFNGDKRGAIGAIDLIGRGSDFVDKHRWAQEVVDCMNLKKSWQDFVGEENDHLGADSVELGQLANFARPSSRINLDILNPIKVFGCMIVILWHAFIVAMVFSMDSLKTFNQMESDPAALIIMVAGTLIVDTFFVITGIIMGHVTMAKSVVDKQASQASESQGVDMSIKSNQSINAGRVVETSGKSAPKVAIAQSLVYQPHNQPMVVVFIKQWIRDVITRYLRLVPLIFLFYWFKRSVLLYHMSFNKPFVDHGFNKNTSSGACKHESWWTPLNMMPAFLPVSQQCLPPTWSVAADLFFTITLTPILLIMAKRPKLALTLGSALCLLSLMWSTKMHLSIPADREVEIVHMRAHGFGLMFGSLSFLYTYPHLRFCSILIGVLVGYMIHVYDTHKSFEWPQWMRGWATKLSFGLVLAVFVAAVHLQKLKNLAIGYERYLFANLFTSGRVCWALASGVLMARMTTDWRNTYIMRQSANKFWASMVKLNLAILLVHTDVLNYHAFSALVANYFSYRSIIALFAVAYVICIPLAIFMRIVYENPTSKLIKRHILLFILRKLRLNGNASQ